VLLFSRHYGLLVDAQSSSAQCLCCAAQEDPCLLQVTVVIVVWLMADHGVSLRQYIKACCIC
jgi:hypothetical protein